MYGRLLDASGFGDDPVSSPNCPPHLLQPVTSRPQIVVQDQWILHGHDRVLWLPLDYRPTCSAVRDDFVCLGLSSGRVVFFEFNFPP
jgi:hypothetical protein